MLVFAKGPYEDYEIIRVIRINLDNETSIEQIRDFYYEIETDRRKYTYKTLDIIESVFGKGVVAEYTLGDFASYQELKAKRRRQDIRSESGRVDEDYQREQDGRRNLGENQGNINFSLKDKYFYELTDGQVKKLLANSTKMKVYSKVEAESIINTVLEDYMGFGARYGYLSGKTKAEAVEMLWRGLNTADSEKKDKVALDVADYTLLNINYINIFCLLFQDRYK